ncbi:MAG: hypothetical protein WCA46_16120 [Actinocatenispora sp.]
MLGKRLAAMALVLFTVGAAQSVATATYGGGADLTVFAGTGTAGSAGDGGPASKASLGGPGGVAVAHDGTVYICDTANHTVRKVTPAGVISTVAGTGRAGNPGRSLPADAKGPAVDLSLPQSLAVGGDGTVYIADVGMYRVFSLTTDGTLSVLAGNGDRGSSGDGGPATDATLTKPVGLAVAPDGTVYIGDTDARLVRAVSSSGVIRTVAGNGDEQLSAAGGDPTAVPVPYPSSLATDRHGALWIADGLAVQRLSGGTLTTVALPGRPATPGKPTSWRLSSDPSWPPADPPLTNITAVATDRDGVYAVDGSRDMMLRLGPTHSLESVAGFASHDPNVTQLAAGQSGSLYLADPVHNQVYRVRPAVAHGATDQESGTPWWPFAIAAVVALALLAGLVVVLRRRRAG